jgi:DNA-binding winged helix-turn-helix (wHTH) protein
MAYMHCSAGLANLRDSPVREKPSSRPAYARDTEWQESGSLTELTHADRIAMIGLAASIPHEVHQPIAAIATNAQAALRLLDCQATNLEEVRSALASIIQDGNRACKVIGCMRALIKKRRLQLDHLEINEAIPEAIRFIRGEAVNNGVSVKSELADGLPLALADRAHLQRMILDLIINAAETIGSSLRTAPSSKQPLATAELMSNAEHLVRLPDLSNETVLRVGPLELDLLDRTAKRGDRQIDLRPREFQLLKYMMQRSDKLLTRETLLKEVWNYRVVPETNLVDVHIGRLRRKIDGPNGPFLIRNVRGIGFVLSATPFSHCSLPRSGTISSLAIEQFFAPGGRDAAMVTDNDGQIA